MKTKSSSLYLSDSPLWLHVPPTIQVALTTPVQAAYACLLNGQEISITNEDVIQIDSASPDRLIVRSIKDQGTLQLQEFSLKYGYEAIAKIAETTLPSAEHLPQQCLVLETSEVAHCFLFHKLIEGRNWYNALLYLSNKLQGPSSEKELAVVFDLQVMPQVSKRWREFEVTLVTENGNSVERLVVDYAEGNIPATVNDFLETTCKSLCVADFQALVSLLETFRHEEVLLSDSQTRFYQTLMPYKPSSGFVADKNTLVEFKAGSRLGDTAKCELQISLRLTKRKFTPPESKLEHTLSALKLQKLGLILQSIQMNQDPQAQYRRLSGRYHPKRKPPTETLASARTSFRTKPRRRTQARVIETARISLEAPKLEDTSRDSECRAF